MSEEKQNLEHATPDELRLAGELRDALGSNADSEVRALADALRHGFAPSALSSEELDHLVAEAIAFAPTEEELAAARAFRDDLEANAGDAALVRSALRAALEPAAVPADLDARAKQAIDQPRTGKVLVFRPRTVLTASAMLVAIAASFLLYVRHASELAPPNSLHLGDTAAALVPARSTQELFDEPFDGRAQLASPSLGSARIDRIAQARTSDFRHNRFARWGVK